MSLLFDEQTENRFSTQFAIFSGSCVQDLMGSCSSQITEKKHVKKIHVMKQVHADSKLKNMHYNKGTFSNARACVRVCGGGLLLSVSVSEDFMGTLFYSSLNVFCMFCG